MKIREYNQRAMIIYLTTASDFSLEAFEVHAFSYLVKPFKKEKLFSELDQCIKLHIPSQKKTAVITVKTSEGTILLPLNKINVVEYYDHRLIYHTEDRKKIASIFLSLY